MGLGVIVGVCVLVGRRWGWGGGRRDGGPAGDGGCGVGERVGKRFFPVADSNAHRVCDEELFYER